MVIDIIKETISNACRSNTNAFGPSFFDQHLVLVVRYSHRLAEMLGADTEAVELAAWLHDIAAIRDFALVPRHTTAGAEIARGILREHGCHPERIESIARSIESHSAPVAIGGGLLEEVCLSNADAMSQIARPAYWLYYAFAVRKLDFEQGRQWYRQHITNNWNRLIPQAKAMIAEQYERTQAILAEPAKA